MSGQTSLFDASLSRASDPDTSHAGEAHAKRTPKRKNDMNRLMAVFRQAGATAREAAAACGLDAYAASKRTSDLASRGLIVVVSERACRESGRRARVWRAVPGK